TFASVAPVAAPTFSLAGAGYTGPQSVAIASATSGASIRYTTDGSVPTSTGGTLYTAPVPIRANTALRAVAYESGMTAVHVTSALYTIRCLPGLRAPDCGLPGQPLLQSRRHRASRRRSPPLSRRHRASRRPSLGCSFGEHGRTVVRFRRSPREII